MANFISEWLLGVREERCLKKSNARSAAVL